jgi:hypothetical protein
MRWLRFSPFFISPVTLAGLLLGVTVGACGSERPSFEGSSSSGKPTGGFNAEGGVPIGSADGCSAEAKLVYVVSAEDDLYSFNPPTATFTKVGHLNCPAQGLATPNSMAIDRSGTAWVNYSDGSLFKVSTVNASCQSTPFVKGQNKDFMRFGMAFATNGTNTTDETLYIAGIEDTTPGQPSSGGKGLGTIDLTTFKLTMLGDFSGSLKGQGAELTGTGDGRLFGFFTTNPATLAQIDKAAGATSSDKSLTGVQTGSAWAFSFWGGDFWFYTSSGISPSKVTRLATSGNGELAVVKPDVGSFRIVGAGVSTCAPTEPPR